ncbi:hypothetical protein GOP47_0024788 [Adiantum capillus-veneris]|uniref:Uncharacterized protein n=1 Tax=Adiantum capillus-veneris TaxID=13818 RepID=A0A9D4Z2Y8_ADICA|nr:hypothetical protein GOP47_0024788 [Adiantum capillus-veneris]
MAMAAATVPHVRLQHTSPQLSSSRGPGCSCYLQQLRFPCQRPEQRKLRLQRPHRLLPYANADTVSLQEDETQAQLPLSTEEEDEANCREILRVLDVLKEKRDMTFNEVRLTIMIEDPAEEEERKQYNVENERGCSREEMAAALVDVYEGRIPSDRNVLRELTNEMVNWPNLEDESEASSDPTESPYAKTTDTGVDPRVVARKVKVEFDAAAEIQPGTESDEPDVPPVVVSSCRPFLKKNSSKS